MSAALPAFQIASELGPSPSENEALRELCSRQAEQLERLQEAATEPRATTTPQSNATMPQVERQALVQLLSDLGARIKALEQAAAKQNRTIEDVQKGLKEAEQDIAEIREHFPALVAETRKKVSALEARSAPKETPNNKERLNVIARELLSRANGKQIGITYAEAAKLLKIDKARICQLRQLIYADPRFDIIWHPKKKNTKLICLKKYK